MAAKFNHHPWLESLMTVTVFQVDVPSVQETFKIKSNPLGCNRSCYPQSKTSLKSCDIHSPRCSFVCAEMALPFTKQSNRLESVYEGINCCLFKDKQHRKPNTCYFSNVLWKLCTSCQSLRARSDDKIPRNNRCGYRGGVCGCVCVSVGGIMTDQRAVYTDGEKQETHGICYLLLSLAHFAASMLRRKPEKEKPR